jgi:hypothetical protein
MSGSVKRFISALRRWAAKVRELFKLWAARLKCRLGLHLWTKEGTNWRDTGAFTLGRDLSDELVPAYETDHCCTREGCSATKVKCWVSLGDRLPHRREENAARWKANPRVYRKSKGVRG